MGTDSGCFSVGVRPFQFRGTALNRVSFFYLVEFVHHVFNFLS